MTIRTMLVEDLRTGMVLERHGRVIARSGMYVDPADGIRTIDVTTLRDDGQVQEVKWHCMAIVNVEVPDIFAEEEE